MEETKTTPTDRKPMEGFLRAFKDELIYVFNDKSNQLEYETGWTYIVGTSGWVTALKRASSYTIPYIYNLWGVLDWRDGDNFDNWIIDCAVDHCIIKPMSEDPELQ